MMAKSSMNIRPNETSNVSNYGLSLEKLYTPHIEDINCFLIDIHGFPVKFVHELLLILEMFILYSPLEIRIFSSHFDILE